MHETQNNGDGETEALAKPNPHRSEERGKENHTKTEPTDRPKPSDGHQLGKREPKPTQFACTVSDSDDDQIIWAICSGDEPQGVDTSDFFLASFRDNSGQVGNQENAEPPNRNCADT